MPKQSYYLKCCPFCGGQAKIEETFSGEFRVRCVFCHCQTPLYDITKDAVQRWNSRADAKIKWNSSENVLPTNDIPCLVICRRWSRIENAWRRGTPMILRYLPAERRWDISGMVDVQAWIPLPEFTESELEG